MKTAETDTNLESNRHLLCHLCLLKVIICNYLNVKQRSIIMRQLILNVFTSPAINYLKKCAHIAGYCSTNNIQRPLKALFRTCPTSPFFSCTIALTSVVRPHLWCDVPCDTCPPLHTLSPLWACPLACLPA